MCPQFAACDPLIGPLVCYSDATIEVPINCGATIAVDEPEKIIHKGLIFPNPANDIISIPAGFESDELVLQDMLGKQQFRRLVKPNNQFLISDLPSSIYFASLFQKGRLIGIDKLVVLKN